MYIVIASATTKRILSPKLIGRNIRPTLAEKIKDVQKEREEQFKKLERYTEADHVEP